MFFGLKEGEGEGCNPNFLPTSYLDNSEQNIEEERSMY